MIGERIKQALAVNGISINKLSQQIGMNQVTLNNQVREVSPLTAETIEKILPFITNISEVWLLRGEGDMKKGSSIKQEVKKMFCPGDDTIFQQVNNGAAESDLRKEIKELKAEKERLLGIIEKLTGSKG